MHPKVSPDQTTPAWCRVPSGLRRGRETRRKSLRVAQSHAASDTGALLTRADAQSPEPPFNAGEGRAVPP